MVPTFRLDDLVEGPVGFLKMDVEGAEGRVVQGATRIIERDRPIVTTELKDEMLFRVSGTTVAHYLGYFERLGYTPSVLEKATGAEKPYPSVAELLADWGESDELRDVLLLPGATDSRRWSDRRIRGHPSVATRHPTWRNPTPALPGRDLIAGRAHERVEQLVDVVGDHEGLDLGLPDESLLDGVAHEDEEIVEEAVDVEDAAGLVVDAELSPCHRLHELLVGPEPAGKHHEGVASSDMSALRSCMVRTT